MHMLRQNRRSWLLSLKGEVLRAYILAGGLGTRMSEKTHLVPKPMVDVGGKPLIWHIMKSLSLQGLREFVILAGYKAEVIFDFFANYHLRQGTITVSTQSGVVNFTKPREDWHVTVIDTGAETMTGGRLARGLAAMKESESFLFTYGDGLSDVRIPRVRELHMSRNALVTLTAVRPVGRFGALQIESNEVLDFSEKPSGDNQWVNGGYAIAEPELRDFIPSDKTVLETQTLPELARSNNLAAYQHFGYWKAVDTMNDHRIVEEMIARGEHPWLGVEDV